jgi:hypothetical protein
MNLRGGDTLIQFKHEWKAEIAPQPNCSLPPLGASRLVNGDFVNMEIIAVITQTE